MNNTSVVVLTYNSAEHIGALLRSLVALQGDNVRIVVVDNASVDDTASLVGSQYPSIECIANRKNVGYGRANTFAMRREFARGADHVLLLNPDTRVVPEFLGLLVEGAVRHKLDLACPMIMDENGEAVENALATVLKENEEFRRDFELGSFKDHYEVARVVGAALLVSRKAFDVTGGFDSAYFLYYEDFDLCRFACLCGLIVGVVTSSKIRHISSLNRLERISPWRLFHTLHGGAIYHLTGPNSGLMSKCVTLGRFLVGIIRASFRYRYTHKLWVLPAVFVRVAIEAPVLMRKVVRQRITISGEAIRRLSLESGHRATD